MNICENCNKKISGLIIYKCKCNYIKLCNNCKFPENHNCNYDYKLEHKNKLIIQNPLILPKKVESI